MEIRGNRGDPRQSRSSARYSDRVSQRSADVAAPQSTDVAPPEEETVWAELDSRRTLHAFDWGVLAGIGVAIAYGISWGGLALSFGLIAVALMGGWIIGAGVRHGAWRGASHQPARVLQLLGAVLATGAWFGGAFVAYVVSRALLPESDLSLAERLADVSFADYIGQQYEAAGGVHAAALAALTIMGWRSAR